MSVRAALAALCIVAPISARAQSCAEGQEVSIAGTIAADDTEWRMYYFATRSAPTDTGCTVNGVNYRDISPEVTAKCAVGRHVSAKGKVGEYCFDTDEDECLALGADTHAVKATSLTCE